MGEKQEVVMGVADRDTPVLPSHTAVTKTPSPHLPRNSREKWFLELGIILSGGCFYDFVICDFLFSA